MKNITISDQAEVTIRLCISFILISILTLGSLPNVIPQSQIVTIGSAASALTMVLPTLMFSIGAGIFPGIVVQAIIALIMSTILLAIAAMGGKDVYLFCYFLMALILGALRFTPAGSSSPLLLMLVSLNTMSFASKAEEEGLPFVSSLWTEKGVTNPNAMFRNTIIGMFWMTVCLASARVLPPPRTIRSMHSSKLLPKTLRDVAKFIKVVIKYHTEDDISDVDEDETENNNTEFTDGGSDDENSQSNMNDAIIQIVEDAAITMSGGVSSLTALEPRLTRVCCQCAAPVDIVKLLTDLTNKVNSMIFSSLTLRAFSKAGYEELQMEGLKEVYLNVADQLERCADALATMKKTESGLSTFVSDDEDTEKLPFDPIRLIHHAMNVEKATNDYIHEFGVIDRSRSHVDKSARNAWLVGLKPWIMGAGFGLMLAILSCLVTFLKPMTWKRICLYPYYDLPKFAFILKFAIGFTALACMQVYWQAFANFEIQASDTTDLVSFSGWYLIAYSFTTTTTCEGTWKKGTLRLIGTVCGGFSGWLAITACKDSAIGLGIWMVV